MTAFRMTVNGRIHEIEIVRRRPTLVLRVDGRTRTVGDATRGSDGKQSVSIDGIVHAFTRAGLANRQIVRLEGRTFEATTVDPRSELEVAGGEGLIKAPMPGMLISIQKAAGDSVKRGETVVTIESMKLQMGLAAPRDGVIATLLKQEGQSVEIDEIIVRLEGLVPEA